MALKRIVIPAPVVSLVAAKAHLKVEHDDHDDLITDMTAAATDSVDGPGGFLGRAVGPQTWDLTLDAFPACAGEIKLPLPPLIAVEGVWYQASAGVEAELDPGAYAVSGVGDLVGCGRVALVPNGSWPTPALVGGAVRVRFEAGYQDTSSPPVASPPSAIVQAIKLILGDLYANRETVVLGETVARLPYAAEFLLRRHRYYLSLA